MKQRSQFQWMYSTSVWRLRRLDQLKRQPLCDMCLQSGRVTEARVVHHVTPHKGDWTIFCQSPLQSLCKRCHDEHTASVERAGTKRKVEIGLDGWPIERG
jgi:5-methylcytosine-specific restriction protein A